MWPVRKLFSILRNLILIASINIYIFKFIGLYVRAFSNIFFIKIYIIAKNKLQKYVLKFDISFFNLYQILFFIYITIYLIFFIIIIF